MQSNRLGWILRSPTPVLLALFGVVPFIYIVWIAFHQWTPFGADPHVIHNGALRCSSSMAPVQRNVTGPGPTSAETGRGTSFSRNCFRIYAIRASSNGENSDNRWQSPRFRG